MPKPPRKELPPAEAEAKMVAVQNRASAHVKQVISLAEAFFAYLESRGITEVTGETVRQFISSRMTNGSPRTNHKEYGIARDYHFQSGNRKKVFDAIEEARFANGLKRSAGNAKHARVKRYPTLALMLEMVDVDPDEEIDQLEVAKRAYFYVMIVTGNRPRHVFLASEITPEEDGLVVDWGMRKAIERQRCTFKYPYDWSGPPCDAIREYLEGHNDRYEASQRTEPTGWRFHKAWRTAEAPDGFNFSANIHSWLKGKPSPAMRSWTATTPRDVLTTAAVELVGTQIRSEPMYKALFDQQEHTQISNYSPGPKGRRQYTMDDD